MMDNAVGVLIDISNSPFASPSPIHKSTKKHSVHHNVPTEVLVNLSDSCGFSYSDSSEVKVEQNSIQVKLELNYSQVFSEQFNNSLIPDCILWDPKMRLDYQAEKLSPNKENDALQQTANNPISNGVQAAIVKRVGIIAEKIVATSKEESSLAITSTPTEDRAPNVDENFKIFKRELSFGTSPTERMRRSVVSSSAGSMVAHDNNFKPIVLQPTILFNGPVKLAKGVCSKPSVPSRRTSTQPNLKKLNQELTNQKAADFSIEQKNKVNLKTRVSLAPPPRQLTKACEPVRGTGLLTPSGHPGGLLPPRHTGLHPPRQLGELPAPRQLEGISQNKQKVNSTSTAIHPPKLQQRKLSQPLDNSKLKPFNNRSSTPTATKSSVVTNQRDSTQKNQLGNQMKKGGSRLPSLDRKNVSTKSANNSNKKANVGRHQTQLTTAPLERNNKKNAQQQSAKELIGLKKMEKPPVKPSTTRMLPKNIKK